jgi:hypothetical protein
LIPVSRAISRSLTPVTVAADLRDQILQIRAHLNH